MSKVLRIDPVTRLEGHGKVTIHLDDDGNVESARFHVLEFRGFEKFCEGRMAADMPIITTKICGICPVSHHLAAAKACDALFGVQIPDAAKMLRELMHMGQIIHSHSLHFFYLTAPDFLIGPDSDPSVRNIAGIASTSPELAAKAIRLRQIGQNIIEKVAGRATNPVTAIPGGMSRPLSHEDRFHLLKETEEAISMAKLAISIGHDILEKYSDIFPRFGDIKTGYLGMVKNGNLELYDGDLRFISSDGEVIEEFRPESYLDYIDEHVESYSWMKFPYYKKMGWQNGIYRVAPLARLNVAESINTPLAREEHKNFKKLGGNKPVSGSLYYHYARLIELLYAVERARELLEDDEIVSTEVRVKVERKEGEGVGVIEAPRGVLIHHYWTDDTSRIRKANIIVATSHNNQAINLAVAQVAKEYIKNGNVTEGMLNRIEMAVRCYDPCLSCATHKVELSRKGGKSIKVN